MEKAGTWVVKVVPLDGFEEASERPLRGQNLVAANDLAMEFDSTAAAGLWRLPWRSREDSSA